jgi:predicted PurR-regulated permease PerM
MDQTTRASRQFFLVLLLATTTLLALVIWPIAIALFLAAILAGVLWPLQLWLTKHLRSRRALASGIVVLLVVVILLGPILTFSAFAITEIANGARFLFDTLRSGGTAGLLDRLPKSLGDFVRIAFEQLPSRVEGELMRSFGRQLSAQGGNAAMAFGATLSATATATFQAFMMMVALYFFLLQGNQLVGWLDGILPLKRGHFLELLVEFKKVAFAVLLSSLITSAVQAVAALIGYLVVSVPHPMFFTGTTFFVAFVPAFGAAGVCLVAALLLFVTGHPYAALLLALWAVTVVGTVDNLIKPLLLKFGLHMNGAIVFFSLIGGLGAFGAMGILLGPLVVSLFVALLRMYKRDYSVNNTAE